MENLESRWINLFSSVDTDEAIVKKAFDDLVSRYSEKHRYYHSLKHIDACLKLLDEVEDSIMDLFSVEIAIWFHDVIYEPLKNDNEEKSAEYALQTLEPMGLTSAHISKIVHLIRLTKHPSIPLENDEKYLIDIDLSILGASEGLYDNYESWVRKEYIRVPSFLYKRGRNKVLNSFLESNAIYQTDYFHQKYETQARLNLERALRQL